MTPEPQAPSPGEAMPKAVHEAIEQLRVDASDFMHHDTTSDLSARLMCRVGHQSITRLLAWVGQFQETTDA